MKKVKILSVLILSLILMSLCTAPVMADPYSYTVRVFAGNQGTEKGALVWEQTYPAYGECFLPRELAQGVLEPGSKYYVKGFKESGYGGEYVCHAENFVVDRDYDFIIAYGMPDRQVSYTISFLEWETGNVLADPITYYGNLDDKPVVAYQYIEGYRPLYRNITATLKESGNYWTFEYVKQEEPKPQAVDAKEADNQNTPAAATQGAPAANGGTVGTVRGGTPATNVGTPAANAGTPAANTGTPAANTGAPAGTDPQAANAQDPGSEAAQPETSDAVRILAEGVQEPVNSPAPQAQEITSEPEDSVAPAQEPQTNPSAGIVNTGTGEVIRETPVSSVVSNNQAAVNSRVADEDPATEPADEADRGHAVANVVMQKPEFSRAAAPETIAVLDLDAQEEASSDQADGETAETTIDNNTAQTDTGTSESANGESDLRGETTHGKALSTEAIIGIIAGCVAALALILWLISRNRRKE